MFHNLPSGGAKRAVLEWTSRLAKDHLIDVYTLSTADHDFCDIRPFVRRHQVYPFQPRILFSSPLGRLNQLMRWLDLATLDQLYHEIAQEIHSVGYDVAFIHPCQFTHIPLLIHHLNLPTVYFLHEPFGQAHEIVYRRPYLQSENFLRSTVDQIDPLIKLYRDRLAAIRRENVHRTTLLLANSFFTQQRMHETYGVDPPVCYYGVNTRDFYPMPEIQTEDFLLSVGELTPRKGFDILIEALALLPSHMRPPLKLASNTVDEDERRFIEDLASSRKVRLEIMSHLNTDTLSMAYNRARFCVYSPVQEPFGLVPLEAMACGKAVVGVREGGVAETIRHEETGLLVARDPAAFAQAIESLLFDPDKTHRLGSQGSAYVLENWTWERSTARIEENLSTCARS